MRSVVMSILLVLISASLTLADRPCPPPKFTASAGLEPSVYYSADERQCDLFHACSYPNQTRVATYLCEDGLVFDGVRCTLPQGVDCSTRPDTQPPVPSRNGVCKRQNGVFPVEGECNQYYYCVRGSESKFTCGSSLIFDQNRGVCNHPDQVTSSGSATKCSAEAHYRFQCPNQSGRELHRSPEDCRTFFICSFPALRPHLGGCPFGMVFNQQTQRCDDPKNVPECADYYNRTR